VSEADTIDFNLDRPNTVDSLRYDLNKSGVSRGMTLIVHSSLSSLGWVCGGAVAVILALEEVLGETGTLVMPAHSTDLGDPADWCNPPVPESWKPIIRETMPAFDPDLTPTREMGVIAETFRKQSGVLRSLHPRCSFAAWGQNKTYVTENHDLDFCMGVKSPLGKVYQLNGWVLLLGVGHDRNSSLHLAEYMTEFKGKKIIRDYAPVFRQGKRVWQEYQEINTQSEDFNLIGKAFESTGRCSFSKVGSARATLMRQRELVDFGSAWILKNRI
jgi:aminoglycoside 3-N-acetyltransferase